MYDVTLFTLRSRHITMQRSSPSKRTEMKEKKKRRRRRGIKRSRRLNTRKLTV